MLKRCPTFPSSAGQRRGITLIRVVKSVEIRPEPDEDERKAILAALEAEAEAQVEASGWAALLLPARNGDDGSP